jgi:hypothetical protein
MKIIKNDDERNLVCLFFGVYMVRMNEDEKVQAICNYFSFILICKQLWQKACIVEHSSRSWKKLLSKM